jgi:hypothetical protein
MAKKSKKVEAKIYIGRSLKGLPQYTVFACGELPPHIAEMAAKNEAVAGLIVPISRLQEARRNMRVQGNLLNHYAKNL